MTDRDRRGGFTRIDPDTLTGHEVAAVRSGTWLGTSPRCLFYIEPDDDGPVLRCTLKQAHDGDHLCEEVARGTDADES